MNEYQIITANLSLVSLSISFFLSLSLFYSRKQSKPSGYLAALILIFSFIFLLRFSVSIKAVSAIYLPIFVFPSLYSIGPILFFYTRSTLFFQEAQKKESQVYAVPIGIVFCAFLFLFFRYEEFKNLESIILQTGIVGKSSSIILIFANIYTSYFCFLSFRLIKLYAEESVFQLGNDELERLIWLRSFIGLISTCVILYLVLLILGLFSIVLVPVSPVEGLVQLILVYLALFYVIRKPNLMGIHLEDTKRIEATALLSQEVSPSKYQKQALTTDQRQKIKNKLETFMSEEEAFLEEEISIQSLADRLQIPQHHLSMTINIEFSQNFFQWINQYRIERAKQLLVQPEAKFKNVLNIGLEAGFQSKAAFNKAFKKTTGQTPTEFRNSHHSS
ncbi:DNA-binding helix-turn-helix protein [Leptospira ryugenii]|uniref:DNA-binding helix-turn-helix protein n=1 Tax=Leptospira ryugenii TaxID=1917863 RepID=A0A2P2E2D3_9LEPT|nr:AraC family transcriptional regulator [Leptospira ryugenii]GBF51065.1 DNA-binding helix-turn-helix protein [Leptospira ryugenii]